MIRLETIERLYFMGIGGIGMSALARYFKQQGKEVSGYDRTASALTAELESEGMEIHYSPRADWFDQQSADGSLLVVYTPAIPPDFEELHRVKSLGLPLCKRAELLGLLTQNCFTIAVAGSHGKTTVSSLIAHILHSSSKGCTAFLGGIASNYQSNYVAGNPELLVVEADEYDRSFLQLEPDIAVITAVDSDHLDIYGSREELASAFQEFVGRISPLGHLVARWGLEVHEYFSGRSYSYDLSETNADRHVRDLQSDELGSRFVLNRGSREFQLNWPGLHNVENALAAISVAELLNVPEDEIAAALSTFKGIRRRFEYRHRSPQHILLDDYAHHPEEIRRLLESARRIHGRRRLSLLFQPHLFTRTRDLGEDFAEALSRADQIYLLPIYPAREEPIEGVNSEWLADLIRARPERRPVSLIERSELLERMQKDKPSLLLTVGAGDIDRLVQPLEDLFQSWDLNSSLS